MMIPLHIDMAWRAGGVVGTLIYTSCVQLKWKARDWIYCVASPQDLMLHGD
ncbi:conserved hypothetical protein [Ricinus communis]|uniref:Uncharacterized protein n=1 Tax=Ricinus communis TaxID=3988 RepID=B9S5H3_RICCO|nr:conserved hypothetical protein [Ricinus communis]